MNFVYKFPAVRGIQAKKEYYIAMIPIRYLLKLFQFDGEDCVQPEFRSQRRLNERRIPEIKEYILGNRESYVFSALSASIDGNFKFLENENESNLGILEIDMDATFLINDGQHRKAAISEAVNEDESLLDETISIVFFKDDGLKKSQQMFADLNKHAVKTSNSLATLYDSRDKLAVITTNMINRIEFFKRFTDKERDNLGKNSSKLFTLANMYKANKKIIKNAECDEATEEFLVQYWKSISDNIHEWNELVNKEITKRELRENFIVTLGVVVLSFGRLGSYFYENKDVSMEVLKNLNNVDWLRLNEEWKYRTIRMNGKVMNNDKAVTLTCSKIKELIGIPLSKEELQYEKKLEGNKL